MKPLLPLILMLFSSFASAFAEDGSYRVDLDNDGHEESVIVRQRFDTFEDMPSLAIEGIVMVFKSDGSKVGSFSMSDHMGEVEFVNLNQDGSKQIVAWSFGGAHYTNIAIYGYEDNILYEIFRNGSACFIKVDFAADRPTIKMGRPDWEKENWSYASGEYLWEVYAWNGKEFVYDKNLSTTAAPQGKLLYSFIPGMPHTPR